MTDDRRETPRVQSFSPREAPSRASSTPYPRWKVELFRTRTADLHARGAAHATGRALRAPGA
jgi:hypothetical protein